MQPDRTCPCLIVIHILIGLSALCAASFALAAPSGETSLPYIEGFSDYTEHGEYSEAYVSDWSRLDSGRSFAPDRPAVGWTNRAFPKLSEPVANEDFPLWHTSPSEDPDVHLTGDDIPPLQVRWTADETSYETSVIRIHNKRHVVIENIAIEQLGHVDRNDPSKLRTGKHSIFVDGCESLVVRNVYLAGAVSHSHLRVRGCRSVFIENVKVRGLPVERLLSPEARDGLGEGRIAGSGIRIDNGNDAGLDCSEVRDGEVDPRYVNRAVCGEDSAECFVHDLAWVVIQNSHVYDYTLNPDRADTNHDGIVIESAADGIIFNNVVENWWGGNALVDVSHRRGCDEGYRGHRLRVERNLLLGSPYEPSTVKTPGRGSSDNAILMANNFYKDLHIVDYHEDYPVYHVNESFYASDDATRKVWYKMYDLGPSIVENQFVRSPEGEVRMSLFKTNGVLADDPSEWIEGESLSADFNLYAISGSRSFLWPEVAALVTEFEDWQGAGQDVDSALEEECSAIVPGSEMCGAEGLGSDWRSKEDPALVVDRDFFGAVRGHRPTVGALEARTWARIHHPASAIESDVAVGLRRGALIGD
jgi:hypothetical protein